MTATLMPSRTLRALPAADRPREKLLAKGAAALTNAELLAILLTTSGAPGVSVVATAQELLEDTGSLRVVATKNEKQLKRVKGIGQAKALIVLAAVELAKRFAEEEHPLESFTDTASVARHYAVRYRDAAHEVCTLLLLDRQLRIMQSVQLSEGSENRVALLPRDIFRHALTAHAAAIALLHNHPSGNPTPSEDDILHTRRIALLGRELGVPLLDHLIIGNGTYTSLAEHHLL